MVRKNNIEEIKMPKFNWEFKIGDEEKVNEFINRYKVSCWRNNADMYQLDDFIKMDIAAAHLNGSPLDFDLLCKTSDAELSRIVITLNRSVDRRNGGLPDECLKEYRVVGNTVCLPSWYRDNKKEEV